MTDLRPVLIADDDAELVEILAEHLAASGFAPSTAGTATAAAEKITAADAHFCAIILDVGLPDGDGRDLCARLRKSGVMVPILMLTGADAEQDVVRGLNAGANDYVRKPFRAAELVARLHAQLRLFENSEAATFVIGPYVFRPAFKLLQDPASKRRIRLTDKEASILKFLYRANLREVGRAELLKEIWGYNAVVSTHTLETHIYRLRQKIEIDPAYPRFLLTGNGGYSLDTCRPVAAVPVTAIQMRNRAAA
jgi:DNA-binding response OmpR family regulator